MALAQAESTALDLVDVTVVAVAVPEGRGIATPFRPQYGPASGSPLVDAAGGAFCEAVGPLAAFAAADAGVRQLRAALTRTARRLNALDTVLIPDIRAEIRAVAAALEEEERDDAVRRKRWMSATGRGG